MIRKLLLTQNFTFSTYITIVLFFVFSTSVNAQCAGDDGILSDVCDIPNISSTTINLFNGLGGSPTTGGVWTDDNKSGGLNKTTGILNAQQIKKSGTYTYTYTVTGVPGCVDNTAVVTITIGGYTGVPGPSVSICNLNSAYNLYGAFNGDFLEAQDGGTWVGNTSNLGLNGNFLDATKLNYGITYEYTYSINAIGSCAAPAPSKVFVTIFRSPFPGIPSDLKLCSNQLSSYTNLNLNDRLTGEDAGGIWTESTTDEIDNNDSTDSRINIQNIYNTNGPGTYRFTYTTPTANNVCVDQYSFVDIIIEKQLDYTGATLTVNTPICENEIGSTSISATLKDVINIPNGTYTITYTISGNGTPITTTQSFLNNVLTFPIARSNFSLPGNYTISVTNIVSSTTLNICNNIIPVISAVVKINQIPKINAATLLTAAVCQGSDATVTFSGSSNLADGNYDIIYNLSGSNILNGIPATIEVIGGVSSITIPSVFIPKTGANRITIIKITNSVTGCTNASTLKSDFTINPPLDMSNLGITIKDACISQPTEVILTGLGALTSVEITYNLSDSNSLNSKVVSFSVVSGQGKFPIPASEIPLIGSTTFTITNVTNTITGCTIALNKSVIFTVHALPNPSTTNLSFCSSSNATVASLMPQGNQYQWFDSLTSTAPLASSTSLVTGIYYVKETNLITGCQSELVPATISINTSPQINNATLTIATVCPLSVVTVDFGGPSNLTDGNYNLLYNLTGKNVATAIPAVLNITGGVGSFSIPANLVPNSGSTTIVITNITNANTNCSSTSTLNKPFNIKSLPEISNLNVIIKDICLGQSAKVELTGLGMLNTIDISYSVSGTNSVTLKTIPLTVVGGNVNFDILATDLPNAGLTTFTLSAITNSADVCPLSMNKVINFTVNSPPNVSNLAVTVKDGCPNQPLNVAITGMGTLTNVAFTYTVSAAGNTINLQSGSLVVTAGSTNFTIAGSTVNVLGTYTLIINDISNLTTGCSAVINSISKNFTIFPIPNNPVAYNQEFCKENLKTIANLVPNGLQYKWYDSPTSTTPLQNNKLLVTANYYLREVNTVTGCESNATSISVLINNVPTPILNSNGQLFCGAEKPTIQKLSDNTNYIGNLTWYTAPINGIALSNTDILVEGSTYYGISYNATTQCISLPLEVTVSLTSCNITPDGLAIPDGFSPNGDGINDTFQIIDIEFLFPNYSLEIFNRYGSILFKGNINKAAWDGKNSNSSFINGDAPTGVYFYIINYNKDNLSPKQGQLYLNR